MSPFMMVVALMYLANALYEFHKGHNYPRAIWLLSVAIVVITGDIATQRR